MLRRMSLVSPAMPRPQSATARSFCAASTISSASAGDKPEKNEQCLRKDAANLQAYPRGCTDRSPPSPLERNKSPNRQPPSRFSCRAGRALTGRNPLSQVLAVAVSSCWGRCRRVRGLFYRETNRRRRRRPANSRYPRGRLPDENRRCR